MGSEWRKIPLGELVTLQRGHDLPSQDRKLGDVPIMGSSGLTGYHDTPRCEAPGIVIGRSGNSMGVVSFSDIDFWPLNTALYVTDFKGNDERYIYYLLCQIDFDQFNSGSAQKSLNRNAVYPYEVLATTDKVEQKWIGSLLERYEHKIQLNRQTNQTLEKMAQALFKSWFVDFDPVIDNALEAGNPIPEALKQRAEKRAEQRAQLKATGESSPDSTQASGGDGTQLAFLNPEIRKLFPCEFEETEALGWVPKGWEKKKIDEVFQLLGGHAFKSASYDSDGQYGVVTIKNVQDGSFVRECSNLVAEIPEKMKPHCRLSSGDVLLSLTGNVGRVCSVSDGGYLLNQRVAKIEGREGISRSIAYYFFRQKPLYEMMLVIAKGTAQQNLSPIEAVKLEQLMPETDLLVSLNGFFDSFYSKSIELSSEAITLESLRDTLLPKLISGELRLPSTATTDTSTSDARVSA